MNTKTIIAAGLLGAAALAVQANAAPVAQPSGSEKCYGVAAAGKKAVTVLPYPDQNGANLALSSGRADIVMADSPVAAYAAAQSKGQFQIIGSTYGTAPYGIAVPKKSSQLRDALKAALQQIISNGTYLKILNKWGVGAGGVTSATVNAGGQS